MAIGIAKEILYEAYLQKTSAEETLMRLSKAEDCWKKKGFVSASVEYRCQGMSNICGGESWVVSNRGVNVIKLKQYRYSIYQDSASSFHLNIKLLDFIRVAGPDNKIDYSKGPDL